MRSVWLMFFALAVAFITIGVSGRRAFIYVGLAFMVISLLRLLRTRG